MVRTVNVRALKDRLSAYLRDVKHGDILLVTDRGQVVAELRLPVVGMHVADALLGARERLVETGLLKTGLPNDARVYRRRSAVKLPAAVIDAALSWAREDR